MFCRESIQRGFSLLCNIFFVLLEKNIKIAFEKVFLKSFLSNFGMAKKSVYPPLHIL